MPKNWRDSSKMASETPAGAFSHWNIFWDLQNIILESFCKVQWFFWEDMIHTCWMLPTGDKSVTTLDEYVWFLKLSINYLWLCLTLCYALECSANQWWHFAIVYNVVFFFSLLFTVLWLFIFLLWFYLYLNDYFGHLA